MKIKYLRNNKNMHVNLVVIGILLSFTALKVDVLADDLLDNGVFEAAFQGKIPEWLNGTFIRVGPGKFDFSNFTMNHWLDGYCILSKFEINGSKGSITFHKRFLQSDVYKRAIKFQRPIVCEFATRGYSDPTKSLFSRLISSVIPIELSDNDQLSLFKLGNELFATSETNYFRSFNLSNLESGEKYDTNKLFGTNICSAHPLTDSVTGITYNIGASCLTGLKYHVIKISNPKQLPKDKYSTKELLMKQSKIICSISSSWIGLMSYTHSFGMSNNYLIFIEQPYVMNIAKAFVSVLKGQGYCFKDWLDWRPEFKNRFYIIHKETGALSKIEYVSETPFFFLHFINCYEDHNQIVIDLVGYSNPSFLEDGMKLEKLRRESFASGKNNNKIEDKCRQEPYSYSSGQRFVLPLISSSSSSSSSPFSRGPNGHDLLQLHEIPENVNLVEIKSDARAIRRHNQIIIKPELLTSEGLEFPSMNNKHAGEKHMYFYATGSTSCSNFENSLCKVNCKNKQIMSWNDGNNYFPGEPIFIPTPIPGNSITTSTKTPISITMDKDNNNNNNLEEDDGILISAVSDIKYNAKDFLLFLDAKTMTELGRAQFNSHIPQAIHGLFIQHEISIT